jgi:hypothetical protein
MERQHKAVAQQLADFDAMKKSLMRDLQDRCEKVCCSPFTLPSFVTDSEVMVHRSSSLRFPSTKLVRTTATWRRTRTRRLSNARWTSSLATSTSSPSSRSRCVSPPLFLFPIPILRTPSDPSPTLQLVDQNTTLKRDVALAERKLLARNERIQTLETLLREANEKVNQQNAKFEQKLQAVRERLDQARGALHLSSSSLSEVLTGLSLQLKINPPSVRPSTSAALPSRCVAEEARSRLRAFTLQSILSYCADPSTRAARAPTAAPLASSPDSARPRSGHRRAPSSPRRSFPPPQQPQYYPSPPTRFRPSLSMPSSFLFFLFPLTSIPPFFPTQSIFHPYLEPRSNAIPILASNLNVFDGCEENLTSKDGKAVAVSAFLSLFSPTTVLHRAKMELPTLPRAAVLPTAVLPSSPPLASAPVDSPFPSRPPSPSRVSYAYPPSSQASIAPTASTPASRSGSHSKLLRPRRERQHGLKSFFSKLLGGDKTSGNDSFELDEHRGRRMSNGQVEADGEVERERRLRRIETLASATTVDKVKGPWWKMGRERAQLCVSFAIIALVRFFPSFPHSPFFHSSFNAPQCRSTSPWTQADLLSLCQVGMNDSAIGANVRPFPLLFCFLSF